MNNTKTPIVCKDGITFYFGIFDAKVSLENLISAIYNPAGNTWSANPGGDIVENAIYGYVEKPKDEKVVSEDNRIDASKFAQLCAKYKLSLEFERHSMSDQGDDLPELNITSLNPNAGELWLLLARRKMTKAEQDNCELSSRTEKMIEKFEDLKLDVEVDLATYSDHALITFDARDDDNSFHQLCIDLFNLDEIAHRSDVKDPKEIPKGRNTEATDKIFEMNHKELIRLMSVRKHLMEFNRDCGANEYQRLNLSKPKQHSDEKWEITFTRQMALGEIANGKPNRHTELLIMQLERMGLVVEYQYSMYWDWCFEIKCQNQATMKKMCTDIINTGYQFIRRDYQ